MQEMLQYLDPQHVSNVVSDMLIGFIPKLVAGLLVFGFFWLLARLTRPGLRRLLVRADFAEPLVRLLVDRLYRYTLIVFGLVMGAGQLGIDVGAAVAGLGVAGIAVGFAAREALANMIAGFLIFWDKPFRVGDYITSEGEYGEVRDITMRTTRIRTADNTYVVIPNAEIIDDVLVNHSMYGRARVRVPLGIAYQEDLHRAREVLLQAAAAVDGVEADPEPAVVLKELGDSSVDLEVRVWVEDAADERPVFARTLEACKLALDDAGVEIPFPHLQLFLDDVDDRVWDKAGRLPRLAGEAS